ncbi:MAG: hypothetical protein HZB10_02810 [Candidatus Yonathbacteria bacterium]|nr:hypothetical protein [Candidatus Yonathbacteria bacterium]
MPDDVKSKIADLEKELYSKDFKPHSVEDVLQRKDTTPAPAWDIAKDAASFLDEKERHHKAMKKFVQLSVTFFVIAIGVAGFIWWRGANIVSGEKMEINISAPVSVAGGEPFDSKFIITNNNKVAVEEATLFVEYPVGFYSSINNAELPRYSKKIGSIAPGQSVVSAVSTLLYGGDNITKEPAVILEYRMAGSNATLKKEKTYSIKISSSPVNVRLSMPKEVSSGQEVELIVDVESNSRDTIGALVVDAVYPRDFVFRSSTPAPSYGDNAWLLPGIAPMEKRTIKIQGILEGQEDEEKVVKISVGAQSLKEERLTSVVYNTTSESVVIVRSVLGINVVINNNKTNDNVATLGKGVKVEISWQNNNPTKVTDAVIEAKLKGVVLDRYSIYASGGGFYQSIDNTIVWDKSGVYQFASLNPGEKGAVNFSFSPIALGVDAARLVKNPQMFFEVRARARSVSGTSAPKDIQTFVTRSVKFETDLRLTAQSLFFAGPFTNSGPLPPQADKTTTYTISLTARNSSNNVSESYVKTTLPVYVKWLGNVSPEGESIAYNESTNEVTWNVGRIPSGATREASFQISLTPSITHIGRAPLLTGDITIVGTDDFTKTEVRDKKSPLTTYLAGDSQARPSDSNVIR